MGQKVFLCALGFATLAVACSSQSAGDSNEPQTEGAALNSSAATDGTNVVDISSVTDLSEYMLPPGAGYLMHKSCVHEVPNHAHVRHHRDTGVVEALAADGTSVSYQPCTKPMIRKPLSASDSRTSLQAPFTNGWVAWSSAAAPYNSGYEWFKEVNGTWYVPANPSHNGGLLYFFNSLEPSDGSEIIQPVLQWGSNGSFGGNYWSYASWHVYTDDGGGAYYSPPQSGAVTGDYMNGDTWATSCESAGYCNWEIRTYWQHGDEAHSYETDMFLDAFAYPNGIDAVFNTAQQGVLENYNLTSCNQYPSDGSIEFFDTYVYEPKPTNINDFKEVWSSASWSGSNASGVTCGQDAVVFNRAVFIDY